MTKVAVTSRSFSRHPVLRAALLERYDNVTFNDDGKKITGADLLAYLDGHDKAITALEIIDHALLQALPGLKVISKYGVGYDMVDLDAMVDHSVRLGWTGGVNKRSVSELVISMAVALLRHVPIANGEMRTGTFRQHVGRQLSDCTIGIVGCGHVGKDLAKLLRAFGCRVLANDILDFPEFYSETGVMPASLETVLKDSEVVTLHLQLDDTTKNILDERHLGLMKQGAVLINAARGGLVDEAALKSVLKSGALAGAGFDVFRTEPPDDLELLNLPNFLATPHIGGSAEEAILNMGRAAIAGLDDNQIPERGVFPEGW
ncbi:MAG: phosphoglycerate dehydrogenase [Rhodospirillaceae bacterium]|nr:phosphoglycerate dehydrogenase [Rhodospirillales bacterium]MBT3906145.1 phosphoglycerate dehydrogenase [Rhodospirillaceae bacterium]MBT4702451.1 phosphoglycerate dehydrogenase [Rhodospirillaceae bacterium]MBT5034829.1 phosphoglycerate dehydrogenase [Rhodospirillaceae bacterium]MBT6219702.1 phosphoglycerate dehydrogenase [Rhodospirillaceae bacterium]